MFSLTKFKKKRTLLKIELELIDHQLENVLSDPNLKNSTDVIELQIKRLSYLDALRFLRPTNKKEIVERQKIFNTFPDWIKNNISDKEQLVFHATTLANTQRILDSGKITSGKDRWTIHTSGDDAGEFSISTKDFLGISMQYHMDLLETYKEYEYFVPVGCLFVLKTNKEEYQLAQKQHHIHNVYFKNNPNQLYAIITTPENQKRVKWWMQKNNFDPDKVYDFKSFKNKIEEDNLFFSLIHFFHQRH